MPAAKRARSAKRASGKRAKTLVRITDCRGNRVGIDPRRVIKIREAGIADEPKDTVFIDYASGGTFARGTLAEIVPLFGAHIPLAALHAPNGMAIVLPSGENDTEYSVSGADWNPATSLPEAASQS